MTILSFVSRAALSPEDRSQLSRVIWVVGTGGNVLVSAAQIGNAMGWPGEPGPDPLYVGILVLIFFASLQFVRLLFASRSSFSE